MSRVKSVTGGSGAWVVAAVFALVGASSAVAGPAIDVPAQVFAQGQSGAKPAIKLNLEPAGGPQPRNWAVGRSFDVKVPVGSGQRLPFRLHILSSEEVCHDATGVATAARNREQDFIRGGEH